MKEQIHSPVLALPQLLNFKSKPGGIHEAFIQNLRPKIGCDIRLIGILPINSTCCSRCPKSPRGDITLVQRDSGGLHLEPCPVPHAAAMTLPLMIAECLKGLSPKSKLARCHIRRNMCCRLAVEQFTIYERLTIRMQVLTTDKPEAHSWKHRIQVPVVLDKVFTESFQCYS